jgi:hypothetical protein
VVAIDITSSDDGNTFGGTMAYAGEGPIGFKSEGIDGGVYDVENQWGGTSAPWNAGGVWVMGCRPDQNVIVVNITSEDGGASLQGNMTYGGEGPIEFRGSQIASNTYAVENQWGGSSAPWNPGGSWVLGCRTGQDVVALDVASGDYGNSLQGTMVYAGEGPIGFRATLR